MGHWTELRLEDSNDTVEKALNWGLWSWKHSTLPASDIPLWQGEGNYHELHTYALRSQRNSGRGKTWRGIKTLDLDKPEHVMRLGSLQGRLGGGGGSGSFPECSSDSAFSRSLAKSPIVNRVMTRIKAIPFWLRIWLSRVLATKA